MFLANWFELSGVDEILAPTNEDSPAVKKGIDEESPIWEILAPRMNNITPGNGNGTANEAIATANNDAAENGDRNFVECQHCHELTPINGPRSAPPAYYQLPTASNEHQADTEDLNRRVLLACKGAAETLNSANFKQIHQMFGYCLPHVKTKSEPVARDNYDPNNPSKKLTKLINLLNKNPALITARSSNMEDLQNIKDGFTILHAACYGRGNPEVVDYLLKEYILKESTIEDEDEEEGSRLDINDTNTLGRTALHIAGEQCNLEILKMLKDAFDTLEKRDGGDKVDVMTEQLKCLSTNNGQKATTFVSSPKPRMMKNGRSPKRSPFRCTGADAPLDLSKKTPFALAVESKSKGNRKESKKLLYHKEDPCLKGVDKTPPMERCGNKRGMFSPMNNRSPRPINYLSPTPKMKTPRTQMTSNSVYATPFSASPTTDDDDGLFWGVSDMPGMRIGMEDAICCNYPIPAPPVPDKFDGDTTVPTIGVFGVFDGHGDGGLASKFVASNLLLKLSSHNQWPVAYHSIDSDTNSTAEGDGAMMTVLEQSFLALDDDLRNDPTQMKNGGSTAIVAVVSDGKMFVANVGDSRCILVKRRDGSSKEKNATLNSETLEVIPLSEDHKPDLPSERARIQAAGMEVYTEHITLEEGESGPTTLHKVKIPNSKNMLAMARAFGDFDFKSNQDLSPSRQAVICTPEIVIRSRNVDEDMYLILACDGVWDVMSDEEVGLFVAQKAAERNASSRSSKNENMDVLASVGDDLLSHCMEKGSQDNMSVLILAFPASGLKSEDDKGGGKKLEF